MAMGTLDMSTVRLIPDNLTMRQTVDMPIFLITDWKLKNKTMGKGLSMVVLLKRKITSEMMTTYFPTLLLITITFATTFFKPFFFEAALSVNLTTMLVMTTIFISKMESLPPTSDIKMIDIWLVFCQLVPFAEVVLLTAMEYQREDTEETTENEITVLPIPMDEDECNEDAPQKRRSWDRLISVCKVPALKTLGEYDTIFILSLLKGERKMKNSM